MDTPTIKPFMPKVELMGGFLPNLELRLRILHIHGAKTLKIRPLCHVLLHYSITRPFIKNLYDTFLTKWQKVSYRFLIDGLVIK